MKCIIAFVTILLVTLFLPVNSVSADTVLEPFTYTENFETRTLGAWASYPLWQDTAYDPNFRVNEIIPVDKNISVVQKVTPYTNVDNYAGAQKLFDMYLVPGSSITLRYYLKSNLPFEFFKVRLAAGGDGKVDFTISNPSLNRWEWVTVTFADFIRQNPGLAGKDRIKVNALAVLAKLPDADPAMPFYLGLDDITFKGARAMAFKFSEPAVYKLSEWKPYIPQKHYYRGDIFTLKGLWPLDASKVTLKLASLTDKKNILLTTNLKKQDSQWVLEKLPLKYPDGLYLGTLEAFKGNEMLSSTEFTIHIAPENIGGKHPRLWFDSETKKRVDERLKSERFKSVYDQIVSNAARRRKNVPVESLIFDLDQFPDETWLPTWSAWGSHIYPTGDAVYWNALAYSFLGDREAGEYVRDVLLKLAKYDNWTHPWQTNRGRFSEHRSGAWAHSLAIAYDLVYDVMNENERILIRKAMFDNVVMGVHRTYVVNNNVTCNTSNWVAHVAGASMMIQSAVFGDGPDVEYLEPYFTGAALKLYDHIEKTVDPDGTWSEGYGYNSYTFRTLCQSIPSINNVFKIDMSQPLNGTYKEYIWAGPIKDKNYFYYGDSSASLSQISQWAWLLDRNKDPLLGWFYNHLKRGETFYDVLFESENVSKDDPFDENPVKVFRGVGTTVFKSGWENDDFIFVMRTGPFYNHQHLDQGSFWLADRGSVFMEERHGSTYYDDPLYQPWYTQPVSHSTILVDGNHQSQRVGDHLVFAEGFEDYAHITHFLDGKNAAFSSGDIGRLYWGKVKSLKRNVLYIKPRTLLMLDTAVPGDRDADVTLLYNTLRLGDISAGDEKSTISKDGNTLHISHLYPEHMKIESVETPHYLNTLNNENPLVKEGMLTVTARTARRPLVMANLLTTTKGEEPAVSCEPGDGFMSGTANGVPFAFSTNPGTLYKYNTIETDAAAITTEGGQIFAAVCKKLARDGKVLVASDNPATFEISPGKIKWYQCTESEVAFGVESQPGSVTVNGKRISSFKYDSEQKAVVLTLPAGESTVEF
ncbi:heparinase II/III family protein [Candidatus Latescibacterota bacterium]